MDGDPDIVGELQRRFSRAVLAVQATADGIPTLWVAPAEVPAVLGYLKREAPRPFRMLYDLTAIDERARKSRAGQVDSDFTVVYHLLSLERGQDVRIKAPLKGDSPATDTIVGLWPSADWYEREAWDMFGVGFRGHPRLRRILMPPWWQGHPLRKEHPARATEMPPFRMTPADRQAWMESMRFRPEDWGMKTHGPDSDFMFLNFGPHHPGTHGVFRVMLQLDGQEIVQAVCDIGFHHRGAEKMGERQTWHTYIPYTDRWITWPAC